MGEKPPITLDLHPHRFYTLLLSQSTTWWKRLMRKTYNCIEVIQLFPCYYSQQHVVTARDIASVSLHTRDLCIHGLAIWGVLGYTSQEWPHPVHSHASAPPYSSSHITHRCGADYNQYAWLWAALSAQLATLPGQNTFNPLISCLLILRSFTQGFLPILLTLWFHILPEVWGVSDKKKDNLINH